MKRFFDCGKTLAAEGLGVDTDQPPQAGSPKVIERKTLLQTLRLTTVDNFQGEEAKVIVVSLVRSNLKGKVSFLRTENRVNVLLGRADVHAQLTRTNTVGAELALYCPRHPKISILCSEPQEFKRKSPEGGHNLLYTRRLEPYSH
ncbi:unnamed protein product [Penicillium camemberti]|uniref:Str. FM013 n=1 Tax=Penicillium camemberti (strain FM 013) TaxID=1429867 RepID=A0A0G4PQI5_PENC3|nr:unnamed protein product [Penicillium camemberti]